MNRTGCLAFFLAGFLAAGCMGAEIVKSANSHDDAAAKTFTPDAGTAHVYAFRSKSMVGGHLKSKLVINNKVAAENGSGEFSLVILHPGEYELGCASGGDTNVTVGFMHNLKKGSLKLKAEAGQIYFVQEVFKPVGGFSLKQVSQAEAEPIVKKGKLIETVQFSE